MVETVESRIPVIKQPFNFCCYEIENVGQQPVDNGDRIKFETNTQSSSQGQIVVNQIDASGSIGAYTKLTLQPGYCYKLRARLEMDNTNSTDTLAYAYGIYKNEDVTQGQVLDANKCIGTQGAVDKKYSSGDLIQSNSVVAIGFVDLREENNAQDIVVAIITTNGGDATRNIAESNLIVESVASQSGPISFN